MNRLLALALLAPVPVLAQVPQSTVTFTFDNPALQPAHYTLVIHQDGTGRYQSTPGSAAVEGPLQPEPQDRAITVPDPLRTQLFALARKNRLFAAKCDSGQKNIAFTGNKTLAYAGPDGSGSCTFNYAKNGQIGQLADNLIAVATTLEEGRRLQLLLDHDKLGLNAEVETLAGEQASGRAQALGNIVPVLRAIAADPDVLNHTRARVETLLAR